MTGRMRCLLGLLIWACRDPIISFRLECCGLILTLHELQYAQESFGHMRMERKEGDGPLKAVDDGDPAEN